MFEQNGVEWSGMEWNRIQWSEWKKWNEMEWKGMELSGEEWYSNECLRVWPWTVRDELTASCFRALRCEPDCDQGHFTKLLPLMEVLSEAAAPSPTGTGLFLRFQMGSLFSWAVLCQGVCSGKMCPTGSHSAASHEHSTSWSTAGLKMERALMATIVTILYLCHIMP